MNNSTEILDNGTLAASTASITTTTTNTTATTTTTTSLPTITTTTTAVVDDGNAVALDALIAGAPAYLKSGKDQNSYIFTLGPEAISSEEILDKMALYIKNFKKNRGPVQTMLYDEFKENTCNFVKDIKIFSASSLENSQLVAFNRELSTKDGRNEFTNNMNYSILGNDMAEMRSSEEARKPGNQLALLMRVPMWNGTGNQEALNEEQAVRPLILSVCAPALDFQTQPEWKQYVEENGDLKENAFGVALSTLSKQVVACAKENPDHKVVLSAFGMNNFINGLDDNSHQRALAIGVANMRQLVTELRQESIEVGYTDGEKGASFWQEVQNKSSVEIEYMGRVPGQWISNKMIIVNAWDPCSVIGNGCKNDHSIDGFIGRNSLVHEAHVMLIRAFRENLLTAETVAARV